MVLVYAKSMMIRAAVLKFFHARASGNFQLIQIQARKKSSRQRESQKASKVKIGKQK